MIKLIIFDLDGTLVDSRELHYQTLNKALKDIDESYIITKEEHISTYDGLPTSKKLELLTKYKNLSKTLYTQIWETKQKYTHDAILHLEPDNRIIEVLKELKNLGYLLYVSSNSIYTTVKSFLVQKGFINYIDYFIGNEDVKHPKPSPEMYYKCLSRANVSVNECLILEDSDVGRKSALSSGCHLLPVKDTSDINLFKILGFIEKLMSVSHDIRWKHPLNVLIPMSGEGSRFANAGYTFPKPLIEVRGKPMIEVVVRNLNLDARYIFVVRKAHYDKYNLQYLLNLIAPNCSIIQVDKLTEGAAATCLLAKDLINNDTPLVIANSDQFIEWNSNRFMYTMSNEEVDGGIAVFEASHPKWSYAKLDDNGFVCDVQEKKVISNHATVGIYYFKHGSDYVSAAESMINKDIRVNGEFYTAPVFNEMIVLGKKIKPFFVDKMYGIGIPEDLNYFLENYNGEL